MRLIFDIETNGLLDKLDRVHSLCIKDADNGQGYSCCDAYNALAHKPHWTYMSIEDGLKMLMKADKFIGHNIIKFDLPGIQKVYPWFDYRIEQVYDTLILSRLIWSDLGDQDSLLIRRGKLPPRARGSHGLEAWGHRLGLHKGDYSAMMKEKDLDPWASWNLPMQDYCELDVEVTEKLLLLVESKKVSPRAVELEHLFAYIIGKQERFGYAFDVKKASDLYGTLAHKRLEVDEELKQYFKPWFVNDGLMVPKRPNKTLGYMADAPLSKVKLQEFNPASRQQIGDRLIKLYGWKPKLLSDNTGQPQIDEKVLGALPYPPAKLLARRFLLEKRIGQLAEGQQAWLKLERKGRIHGGVNTIGAVTGRCTHSNPNVAQVPSLKALYGAECRELFHAPPGWKQVGADAAGLELRCLAHYMAKYDGGLYSKTILEGDVHTVNQLAAGLPTRDAAKTFIYAFLYGAGDEKIGSIVGKGRKVGKQLKDSFLNQTPALKRLREDVGAAVKRKGHLVGIDGRKLHVRYEHAALNTLLQSAGALLVKQATINLYLELSTRGYAFGEHYGMVAHVHDEYQLQVREELAEEVAQVAVWSFQEAGRQFNWRCPLDGEAKIGQNWKDCH